MDFPTTHWSVLAKATLHGEADARAALEVLCQRYWGPVNAFIRFQGLTETEAKDLTQEFMLHVIQKSIFTRADRLQGKFRSFLLGALARFLSDALDRRNALKRGGLIPHIGFEQIESGKDLQHLSKELPAVTAFDREWAVTVLETALDQLRSEFAQAGREEDFNVCKNFLPGASGTSSYESAAARLGMSIPAFKSEIHRIRRRLRSLVRGEISRTVSAPHEIESEMAHLSQVLMDRGSELTQTKRNFPEPNPQKESGRSE
jgi:DNA-directed RNA polymerase specialized sigma24 family protein